MADPRFFSKNGSFKLSEIAEFTHSKLQDENAGDIVIHDIAPLSDAGEGEVTFFQNKKYLEQFKQTKATACITDEASAAKAPKGTKILISENPYYSYAMATCMFYQQESDSTETPSSANIDFTAEIGKGTVIHPGAYIGKNCVIGENCEIHANASIQNSIIGDNVTVHNGTSIGQDGFGYAFQNGRHHKVMQLGRVIIKNNVEIGANVTIDRGAGPDTVIGEGTKIDNLVQIGNNVKIGKHCIIVALAGISGSAEVGDYTVVGGQVGIAGHLKVGKNVQIAAQSGVIKDVKDGEVLGGAPAVPIKQFHRQTLAVQKLLKKD